jgi:hypothetical protein
MMSDDTDETDPLSPAILAAFDRVIALVLQGYTVWEEGKRDDEYVEMSKRVYEALKVKPWDGLRLESDEPPLWIARVPELAASAVATCGRWSRKRSVSGETHGQTRRRSMCLRPHRRRHRRSAAPAGLLEVRRTRGGEGRPARGRAAPPHPRRVGGLRRDRPRRLLGPPRPIRCALTESGCASIIRYARDCSSPRSLGATDSRYHEEEGLERCLRSSRGA